MVAESIDEFAISQFESAFVRDWRSVVRFALASTNDLDAAEDLAQDAFARLWQKRHQFDWSKPALPWLLVATHNLATDRFRALQRRILGAPPATLSDNTRERWLDTRRAMSRLSRTERVAIVLNAMEGYPTEEVGELLGISAGAVRAAVSRARRKLEEAG
jgi:RNA polymerase sigma factor (sigma-70 family)